MYPASDVASSPAPDREVERYVLTELCTRLGREEFERLKGALRDHREPSKPAYLPVPAEQRAEASAFLVHYLVSTSLGLCDLFAEASNSEELAEMWRRMGPASSEMVAADLQLLWSDGLVNRPAFYGLGPDVLLELPVRGVVTEDGSVRWRKVAS